jgi:DNA (cytosine-5)-methyltransferase 1
MTLEPSRPTSPMSGELMLSAGGSPVRTSVAPVGRLDSAASDSGLFYEIMRIVSVLGPRIIVLENVAALIVRGLDSVLGELDALGFDAEWSVIPACAFGAPHPRERVFIIAHRDQERWDRPGRDSDRCDGVLHGRWNGKATPEGAEWRDVERWLVETLDHGDWDSPETALQRVDDGIPAWLGRNGMCGNAVVPQVAEWIGRRLME